MGRGAGGFGGARGWGGGGGGGGGEGGETGDTVPKKDEGPLHPSWEAARKAKEAKTNVTFQGKKVKFD